MCFHHVYFVGRIENTLHDLLLCASIKKKKKKLCRSTIQQRAKNLLISMPQNPTFYLWFYLHFEEKTFCVLGGKSQAPPSSSSLPFSNQTTFFIPIFSIFLSFFLVFYPTKQILVKWDKIKLSLIYIKYLQHFKTLLFSI